MKDRLKLARQAKGLTQTELAKAAGTTQTTIYHIESGVVENTKKLNELANVLDTTPEYLLFGITNAVKNDSKGYNTSNSFVRIPTLRLTTQDEGVFIDMENTVSVPAEWIEGRESLVAITMPDDSMMPRIKKGDQVIVDTQEKDFDNGKVFLFTSDNELHCRYTIKQLGGSWQLKAEQDSHHYPVAHINNSKDLGDMSVLGRCIKVMASL